MIGSVLGGFGGWITEDELQGDDSDVSAEE